MFAKVRMLVVAVSAASVLLLAVAGQAAGGGPGGSSPAAGGAPIDGVVFLEGGSVVMGSPLSPLAYDDCTAGRFCLWDETGYAGSWIYRTDTGWYNLTTFDNRAESARNNSIYTGKVATGYGGGGSQQCHNAGGHFFSLGATFNNAVSSWNFRISC